MGRRGPAGSTRATPPTAAAGYGKHKRPDLSNTQFFLDALKAAGDGPDDPGGASGRWSSSPAARTSKASTTPRPSPAKNPDGGFYYTPAAGGDSEAGKTANGGLRSYGSMTYAGLKSMIYAGVRPDDPRVKAAVKWCQMHYGLDSNPGMGNAGLYYYYHTFAKALDAAGLKLIEDDKGVEARLAAGPAGRAGPPAAAQRLLGQRGHALVGGRAQPGDRLRLAVAGLLPPKCGEVMQTHGSALRNRLGRDRGRNLLPRSDWHRAAACGIDRPLAGGIAARGRAFVGGVLALRRRGDRGLAAPGPT